MMITQSGQFKRQKNTTYFSTIIAKNSYFYCLMRLLSGNVTWTGTWNHAWNYNFFVATCNYCPRHNEAKKATGQDSSQNQSTRYI